MQRGEKISLTHILKKKRCLLIVYKMIDLKVTWKKIEKVWKREEN